MYEIDSGRLAGLKTNRWSLVGPNVYYLGATSLLTDISSEMVAAILPVYLVFALHLSPLQYGLVDGLYQGAAAIAGLAGGWLADRWNRNREVAASGYGLSALCKLGLLAAGNAWGLIAGVIALDRMGKGIRTAPRDALISLSSASQHRGFAFGVHRAFDTAGALLGPLAAFAILATLRDAYDVVFVTSFFIAIVGVATLLLFVKNPGERRGAPDRPATGSAARLLQNRRFLGILWPALLLSLVAVPDAFFYLTIQRRASLGVAEFPLLPVGTALTFLLLAIPAGRVGDAIGRTKVFVIGYVVLFGACACLLLPLPDPLGSVLALALLGVYYACTAGVLMAAASAFIPEYQRATGLAILVTAIGISRLFASVLFGAAWERWGIEVALMSFTAALALVILIVSRPLLRLGHGT